MKRISKIEIRKETDTYTDLDYLQTEYKEDSEGNITIIKSMRYSNDDVKKYGNEEVKKWIESDKRRLKQYETGEMVDYGITAIAKIQTSQDGKNWLINTITSGGLWGLSSDGDESDFKEVEEEQKEELKTTLKELGFTAQEIDLIM